MRLSRFRLRNYGCFADLDLQLATEPGRLTLIVAPNGAGKSVLRHAFHDLLFDIPMQSPMKFRHGYAGMSLHAEAEMADGASFSFGWDRGAKPQRVTSDDALFAALRNRVTPQQLESLFALDTTRLRKGGTDLKGGVTLSEALLAGTGELASAKAVRAVLDARRNENWGKGRSRPPLNAAAARLEETRRRVRDAVVRPEARERDERTSAERGRELEQARTQRFEAMAEMRRLNRVSLVRPHLLAAEEAEAWLADHPDAPALPLELEAKLAAARQEVALARTRHEDAERLKKKATEDAEAIVRDPVCNRLAQELAALAGLLGEAENKVGDMAIRTAERAAKMEDVLDGLRAIGSDLPAERAAEVIPTAALKADVQTAVTEGAKLGAALEPARLGVQKARAALRKAEDELTVAEPLPDGLPALLAEARADRNPVTHAEETRGAVDAASTEVKRLLAKTAGWKGTAEELRSVTLAPEADFERLDGDRMGAAAAAEAAASRRLDLEAQEKEARDALIALRPDRLPDTTSVMAARAERDRGMRLVLARAYGAAPSATEEEGFANGEPMPFAFERKVREADDLADRREAELERVREAEGLRRRIAALAELLREASAAETTAQEKLVAAEAAWAQAVKPLGLGARTTMNGLRQACDARRTLIDALARSETATQAQVALAEKHRVWAERIAACLGVEVSPLESLLAVADARVAKAQEEERAVTRRQAALDGAKRALPEAEATFNEASEKMGRWGDAWVGLLRRLGRSPEESPAAVSAVLEAISALEVRHREALSLTKRIDGMKADLDRFGQTVAAYALQLGHPAGASDVETARDLIARAGAASKAEGAWSQAQQTTRSATEAERVARDGLREAVATLDAVIAACGAADPEGAEARIAASRAHADQVARRDVARAKLDEHGDGLGVAALRSEMEAVPVDEVATRRQTAAEAADLAQARAEEASAALRASQAELDLAAASTEPMEAQADHAAAAATFGRLLEDQLVLHVASAMLGKAVRSVAEDTGGSELARTSAAFSAVTGGAYVLESHDGPKGEELYAVEQAFPNERKELPELSEGTRDQLYLALRIEALRGHCRSAMAVPFIADDILQTFDDVRAAAALRALGELSADLQVIVLTHHAHLRAVAQSLEPERLKLVSI